MAKKKKDFWDKFGDMMDGLGDYLEEKADTLNEYVDKKDFNYTSIKSVTEQNGVKIVTNTVNGKSTITINGEEMVPKSLADDLYSALETFVKSTPIESASTKASAAVSKACKNYDKYKEKNNL